MPAANPLPLTVAARARRRRRVRVLSCLLGAGAFAAAASFSSAAGACSSAAGAFSSAAGAYPSAAGAVTRDELSEPAAGVGPVAPSPDGEQVAYVISRAGGSRELQLADADGRRGRLLTTEAVAVSAAGWSPDGEWLAYLRHPSPEHGELMLMPVAGGPAHRVTAPTLRVREFQWSPAGNTIVFVAESLPLQPAAPVPPATARLLDTVGSTRGLWRLELDGRGKVGLPNRLTPADVDVGSHVAADTAAFDWSPNGREIAFTHTRPAASDPWKSANISLLDVASGRIRPFQQSDAAELSPRYSPDGRRIAFAISVFPPSAIGQWRIGTARTDGSELKLLAATPDEQPSLVGWVGKRTILVREQHGTATALWKLAEKGGDARRFDDASAVLTAVTLNASANRLAFVTMNPTTPPEVAVTALKRYRPVTVSTANRHLSALRTLHTRTLTWHSPDGLPVEGLLTLPHSAEGDRPPALVLMLHDAPAGTFTRAHPAWADGLIPTSRLAERGYAVLRVNARGASGYGYAYRAVSRGDWGGGDVEDLMAGVDQVVEAGLADPHRLAILGWGHGGYLAARTITRHHRFGAAILGAPMSDLVQMRATGEHSGFIADYLGGEFEDYPDLYARLSPLLDAHRITTPVLILHGDADTHVPSAQGLALYRTLRRGGLDSRMVLYPGAGHRLLDNGQREHARGEILAWLERYLSND